MLAAGAGHADVVELLLARGANVDKEDKQGNTALMQLASSGQMFIAQRLIDARRRFPCRKQSLQTI